MAKLVFLLMLALLFLPSAVEAGSSGADASGSIFVVMLESVSRDSLLGGFVELEGVDRNLGSKSYGRGWRRFGGLPSGDYKLSVADLGFEGRHVSVRVRPGHEDTMTVVLNSSEPVKPGHTYLSHPPAPLPERPGDEKKYPLAGFSFSFLTEHGERIDTARGLVTKDLVGDPDTTISLVLSSAELDRVRKSLIAMRFFDIGYTPPNPWPGRFAWPHFEATAGGVTKRLDLPFEMTCFDSYPSDDRKRKRDLIQLIQEVVSRRPEYQALPKSRGVYL